MIIKIVEYFGLIKSFSLTGLLFGTILFFAAQRNLFSQSHHFSFEHYTIADGLSNNSINAVLQTRDGFIWVATKDGLNRFDGQKFVVFKHDPSLKNSIPENYVMSLFESRDGIFWVGTWGGGLCKYDPVHEAFLKIETKFEKDKYVQCIAEDTNNNLWFGTLKWTFKFNHASKKIVTIVQYQQFNSTEE
jgi:ligand-binding sensor domain-containing protein